MLTQKQLDLLKFIYGRTQADGISPSFDEMKLALNLRSKSGIHRLISALEERGFIQRLPHRARAIEILRMPEALGGSEDSSMPINMPPPKRAAPDMDKTRQNAPQSADVIPLHNENNLAPIVPMMGRIAAGTPISAIEDHTKDISVPASMVSSTAEHYALEVKGDSMINAGINNGDVVVIRKTNTAQNGDIVVALVEMEEATLKRFQRNKDAIALEAANPAYETRVFHSNQIKIQGKLVGLIRTY